MHSISGRDACRLMHAVLSRPGEETSRDLIRVQVHAPAGPSLRVVVMVRIEKTKKRGDREEDERRDGWERREKMRRSSSSYLHSLLTCAMVTSLAVTDLT